MKTSFQAVSNLLSEWSRLFVHGLVQAGVRHVVISPGSRSTPLTWAISEHPDIEITSSIDERSAAFFALGRAKYTGKPSAVVCTSGTAPAHFLPAVIEADLAQVPLLLITADRPLELQHCAAPQTVDQLKLFGDFARAFFDLGLPDAAQSSLRAVRRMARQAVATTLAPVAGPVQINFRARKPLEPVPATDDESLDLRGRVRALIEEPFHSVAPGVVEADPLQIEFLAARCRAAQRGVITLGATSPSAPSLGAALAKVLEATPLVLLCEATSQVRLSLPPEISRKSVFDSFDLHFAGREASDLTPDFVLQLGAPPTSGSWERFLASAPDCELHVVTEHGWPDPTSRAASVTQASLPMLLERLASRLDSNPMEAPSSWRDRVQARNAQAWAAVESTLAAARTKSSLDEALAVRIALEALPKGSLLALGNSLAVREVDTVLPAGDRGLRVWSQRGANGIDGLISGASGAASQYSGPCLLLLGDISFLHDVGGLKAAQALRSALVIAVLNNGGGRIFEQLPLMQTPGLPQERLELWLTPQDHELTRAAELYGLRGTTVRTAIDLEQALAAALTHEGATVIDIRVGASSAAEGRKAILSELARATARGKSSA